MTGALARLQEAQRVQRVNDRYLSQKDRRKRARHECGIVTPQQTDGLNYGKIEDVAEHLSKRYAALPLSNILMRAQVAAVPSSERQRSGHHEHLTTSQVHALMQSGVGDFRKQRRSFDCDLLQSP